VAQPDAGDVASPPPPPAPPDAQAGPGQGRTFPCSDCGADLVLVPGTRALRCEHCGHEQPLTVADGAAVEEHDLQAALDRLATRKGTAELAPGRQELQCPSCGAAVSFEGTLTSSACAFCGGPIQLDQAHASRVRLPVDGVLPFGVDAPAARAALATWVKKRWFAPRGFKQRGVSGDLRGLYLPFFTFDAMTDAAYRGERGDHYTVTVGSGDNKREEQRTRWSESSGAFQRFFDDVLVPAFGTLPGPLLEHLEPWPLAGCMPFTPEALAGKLAHTYDVELGGCFTRARARIEDDLRDEARERIGGDEQRIHDLRVGWAGLTFKHVLLPVWLLAYRYRDRSYRVAVNACTGEVHGERPWSVLKLGLVAALAVAAIAFWAWNQVSW